MTADAVERAAAADLAPWQRAGLGRDLRQVCAGPGACVEVDGRAAVSFASCDYLGLARHPRLTEASAAATRERGTSRGSARLLAGHDDGLAALETALSQVFDAPAALVFGSGYLANVAAITGLVGAGDLIVSDVLSHASSIDACRLSRASVRTVDPRDRAALRACLADAGDFRRVLVLVVGVPSMDGAVRPLDLVVEEAERVGAWVVVDDAHGLGSVGPGGRGTAAAFGVGDGVALQVGNLGKALGSYGAFVLCGATTREWLVQTARPFVFTCSLPPGVVAAAEAGVRLLGDEPQRPQRLQQRALDLRRRLAGLGVPVLDADSVGDGEPARVSPVVPVAVGSAERSVELAARLLERGWFVPAVRPPTVPRGSSRLRLTVNVQHDDDQLAGVSAALQEVLS